MRRTFRETLETAKRRAVESTTPQKRRPGREPMPKEQVEEVFHLRHHLIDRWLWVELTDHLVANGDDVTESAVAKRCSAFKQRFPDEARGKACSFCRDLDYRLPPRPRKA